MGGRAFALEDCWGRSIWGLGTAVSHWRRLGCAKRPAQSSSARRGGARPTRRAMAFAALGAAEMLAAEPDHRGAQRCSGTQRTLMAPPCADAAWPWPEARLHYANAVLPEAMIAAGAALDRPILRATRPGSLGWLLGHETLDRTSVGHPRRWRGPGRRPAGFDQQPIEVAAIADACARAAPSTATGVGLRASRAAEAWFLGDNDGRHVMWDPDTGGGYDGLTPRGPNLNQGAESTLALISTLQRGRRLDSASQ